jgi:aspartyl-tRNA(Asn)/glutamyl-tRNA(Gln) amidotransferase subunit A
LNDTDLAFAPIEEIGKLFRKRQLSPVELTKLMLARIEKLNPKLNAFITITAELAVAQAKKAESELFAPHGRKGHRDRGTLHGIPISLKDNIYTQGIRTTAGSTILQDFIPKEDAVVVRQLKQAGAILLGKTNMHEFAYGVTSNNPHYGPVRNPWDLSRISGGSSGGSAGAVAAGLCYGSIGTDTGGSIRIPAALCGVVGLKPGYLTVNARGTVPLAPSLDHVGPLARTVADIASLFNSIASLDAPSSTGAQISHPFPDYCAALRKRNTSITLGMPREYFWERIDQESLKICEASISKWKRQGVRIREVSMPRTAECESPSTAISLAEALVFHWQKGWYPKRAAEYGSDVSQRLEMGRSITTGEYLRAFDFRGTLQAEWAIASQGVDAILAPSVPFPAPGIDVEVVQTSYGEEKVRAALLRLNRPANYTHWPAISIPCGFVASGLPMGIQLIGLDQAKLLRLAQHLERALSAKRRPPIVE